MKGVKGLSTRFKCPRLQQFFNEALHVYILTSNCKMGKRKQNNSLQQISGLASYARNYRNASHNYATKHCVSVKIESRKYDTRFLIQLVAALEECAGKFKGHMWGGVLGPHDRVVGVYKMTKTFGFLNRAGADGFIKAMNAGPFAPYATSSAKRVKNLIRHTRLAP